MTNAGLVPFITELPLKYVVPLTYNLYACPDVPIFTLLAVSVKIAPLPVPDCNINLF